MMPARLLQAAKSCFAGLGSGEVSLAAHQTRWFAFVWCYPLLRGTDNLTTMAAALVVRVGTQLHPVAHRLAAVAGRYGAFVFAYRGDDTVVVHEPWHMAALES